MTSAADVQAVVFGLGNEVFALPVATVREILDYREASRLPNGPDWLLGLTDVRGESVPMVDVKVRLGLPASQATLTTRILVVDVRSGGGTLTLGLVVDRVLDVSIFAAAEVRNAPDIGVRWRSEYISGVVRREDGFVILLDVDHIFASHDGIAMLPGLDTAA